MRTVVCSNFAHTKLVEGESFKFETFTMQEAEGINAGAESLWLLLRSLSLSNTCSSFAFCVPFLGLSHRCTDREGYSAR